jgi:glucose/arabinose dehydrogenase
VGAMARSKSRTSWGLRIASAVGATMALVGAMVVPAGAQSIGRTDPTVEHQVLTEGIADPTALEVTADGRVIYVQREGNVMIWKQDGTVVQAAKLPVDAFDRSQTPGGQYGGGATCPRGDGCPAGFELAEGGIHGILLAPDFEETGHLYLYYTVVASLGSPVDPPKMPGARGPDETEGKFRLSRFTLVGDTLDLASEVPLFENPAEWFHCCHYGGDMEWLSDGTLVLTVGDDTISSESGGFSPHDYRPGQQYNNADLTAQNLADRRGKVLRIDVADVDGDGSLLPADNPFVGVDGADPYIYALGFRSNYRVAVNPATDHLYVATVGPDGRTPNPQRGPAAHEEIEVVPPGGGTNHGWPRCIGDNIAYTEYDFATGQVKSPFDCSGMTPAAFWYTYQPSPTSPYLQMGQGSNTVMAGLVYDRPDTGALRLPATYDNQLVWMENGRSQIWRSPVNADGTLDNDVLDLIPVWYGGLRKPIDSDIGPDGALYLVEYGTGTWNNTNGRISRLMCAGCTPSSADYRGAPVVNPGAELSTAGLGDATTPALSSAGALLALAAAFLLARALRRRRSVI